MALVKRWRVRLIGNLLIGNLLIGVLACQYFQVFLSDLIYLAGLSADTSGPRKAKWHKNKKR
ncbi:MAG TPA: hypothetical protein DD666_15565 [Advenella kashmirensis]|uniref:Uncharacterized protein n=1 Tax=Advenella kashmirensis TaxID=310575 RepID=A0A356LJY0_9BURK|nr:hypothetical protein [Advenella kashmirensis]